MLKFEPAIPAVESKTFGDTQAEVARLRDALSAAVAASTSLQNQARKSADREQAEIFEFHKLLLQDEETVDAAISAISRQNLCAEYAWKTATDAVAKRYESIADDYLRARVADVYDIQKSVLRQLSPTAEPTFAGDKPAILVAPELSPSEVAGLPRDKILGICLAASGATSHAAIIAASRGFPTVVGVTGIFAAVKNGQVIVLDGGEGRILTEPDEATLERFKAEQDAWQAARQRQMRLSQEPAIATDGVRIEIAANIAGPVDLQAALENGAEGVGLFRTEFLFLDRTDAPGEEEQVEVYRTVARQMQGRPAIIRTLDIGGDKQVPYLSADREENPFLGVRGIRLALANRELFLCQLRAILRAGGEGDIRIIFPMIGSVQDFRDALLALEEAKCQLRGRGIAFAEDLPTGVMIEVPSAVVVADQLAEVADFFSIGTNDLAQYVMAADRGNPGVAALPDPFHPAVLRMIKQTVDAAHQAGIPVGMCGAFAGLPEAGGLLVGLGLDELSMNAPAIPGQKAAIREFSAQKARELAARALALTSADEVRELTKTDWQVG